MPNSVLVIDDDAALARAAVRTLTGLGYKASFVENGTQALRALEQNRYFAVVTDLMLPDISGMDILRAARDHNSVAVMISAEPSFDAAVKAMQLGARDFIPKPFDPAQIDAVLRASRLPAAGVLGLAAPGTRESESLDDWRLRYAPEIIGDNSALCRVLETVRRVADVESNVLILGESGTGKELLARAIHRASGRRRGPFVPLNCAAIPDTLVESELFGYAKGAFTGANSSRIGRFQAASRGSIFLDEIGEMNLGVQSKVLRVLQDREFTPVGDVVAQRADVRVIAATHRDLRTEVAERRFREDLFFRLNVIPLRIPPLRERPDDLPLLVAHVIKRVNKASNRAVVAVSAPAMEALARHTWPGNVRELENTIERLVILKSAGTIEEADLQEVDFGTRHAEPTPAPAPAATSAARIITDIDAIVGRGLDLRGAVEAYEGELIAAALQKTNGNQKRAAELLRVNRTTLIEKMRRMHQRAGGQG